MKLFFLLTMLFFMVNLYSQTEKTESEPQASLSLLRSTHGTGDLKGLNVAFGYLHKPNKLLSLDINFTTTLHSGTFPVFYNTPTGRSVDGSFRYTTGGFQSRVAVALNFLRKDKHFANLALGPLLRYQNSSHYDVISVYYPAATGLPVPVVVLENTNPQKTVSIGGELTAFYGYGVSGKIFLGVNAAFQYDSNSDSIFGWGITVVRRFTKKSG